jgi:hypothetical protein
MRLAFFMERKLQNNEHKPDWRCADPLWLFEQLCDAVHEMSHALQYNRRDQVPLTAADVANYAMMIVDTLNPERIEHRGHGVATKYEPKPSDVAGILSQPA